MQTSALSDFVDGNIAAFVAPADAEHAPAAVPASAVGHASAAQHASASVPAPAALQVGHLPALLHWRVLYAIYVTCNAPGYQERPFVVGTAPGSSTGDAHSVAPVVVVVVERIATGS